VGATRVHARNHLGEDVFHLVVGAPLVPEKVALHPGVESLVQGVHGIDACCQDGVAEGRHALHSAHQSRWEDVDPWGLERCEDVVGVGNEPCDVVGLGVVGEELPCFCCVVHFVWKIRNRLFIWSQEECNPSFELALVVAVDADGCAEQPTHDRKE